MRLKRITSVILSFVLVISSLGNIYAAETSVSGVDLSSLKARVTRIQACIPGEYEKRDYIKIVPLSEISYGDTIVLNFENAEVLDEVPSYSGNSDSQGFDDQNSLYTYESACRLYESGATVKAVLDKIWSGSYTDDAYIPWEMTRLSDTSIEVELFPIPDEYCNTYYDSFNKPFYYLPLSVQVLSPGTASVSVEAGGETGESLPFAYVVENEGDDTTGFISGEPESEYTHVSEKASVSNGELLNTYLYLRPWDEVLVNSSVILTFENAKVIPSSVIASSFQFCGNTEDSVYGMSEDQGYNTSSSYSGLIKQIENGAKASTVLSNLWDGNAADDVYIPWYITWLSDTSIKVELFPLPGVYSDNYYTSSGYNNIPYYYIPLCVCADGEEGEKISVTVNNSDYYDCYYTIYDDYTEYFYERGVAAPVSGGIISEAGLITGDNITYELEFDSSTGTVTGCVGKPENIVIPEEIDGVTVTSIGDSAFSGCSSLTGITLPDTVTAVGEKAFYNCSSLESITLTENIASIGNSAFYGCSSLESITLPEGVTSIGDSLFYGCSALSGLTVEGNVTSIGSSAFYGCESLTALAIDSSGVSLGSSAFSGCSSLSDIAFSGGITAVGSSAFYNCKSLSDIAIADTVTSIGSSAFYNCSALKSITIPEGVTTIGSSAFYGCSGLTGITVPEGVKTINSYTFYGCSGLKSITLPDSVTKISSSAFYGCSGLTNITIPDSVTTISNYVFYGCSGLKSITLPEGITSISLYTFYGCSGLKSITLPEGVTTIGSSAFYGCSSLKSINIPEGVTNISSYTFRSCTSLTSITIPKAVTSVSNNAFYDSGLTAVYCYEGSAADDSSLYPDGTEIHYISTSGEETETSAESTTETEETETSTEASSETSTETTTKTTAEASTEAASESSGSTGLMMGYYSETQFITAGSWQAATFGNSCDQANVETDTGYKNWAAADNESTVTLHAEKGKIGDGSSTANAEGIVFYYQSVAADEDFIISATATVNGYTTYNQVAFGLQMRDQIFDNMTNPSQSLGASVAAGGFRLGSGTLYASGYYYNDDGKYISANKAAAYPTDAALFTGGGEALYNGDTIYIKLSYTASSGAVTYTVGDITRTFSISGLETTATFSDEIYVGAFVAREADVTFTDLKLAVGDEIYEAGGWTEGRSYIGVSNYTITPTYDGDDLTDVSISFSGTNKGKLNVNDEEYPYIVSSVSSDANFKLSAHVKIDEYLSGSNMNQTAFGIVLRSDIDMDDTYSEDMETNSYTAGYTNSTTGVTYPGTSGNRISPSVMLSFTNDARTDSYVAGATIRLMDKSMTYASHLAVMEKDIAAGDEFDITLKKFGSAYKATVVDSDGSIYTNAVETSNTFGDIIYPGFFAARNVCVTFSDIDLFVDTRTITNLEITTPPSKTEYYIGEDFDPEGMVVTAVYDDGSKEVFEDYAAVCDTSALGDSTVIVTVGSVSASYPVTVRKMYVTNISLDSEPLINRYYEYQLFTDSGIEGTFTFENGKTEEISETNAEYTVDGSVIDASKYWLSGDAGGKTVYISYADTDTVEGNGVSVSYNITVYPYSLTEIYIASEPYKVDYSIGDEFSSEGLQVLGMYSDGTNVYSDTLSEDTYSILGFSTLTGGTKTATVRLNADTSMKATFTYTVRTPYVTDCSITHYPRTTYAMGTDISEIESEISENMVITVTYSSGLTQTLSSDEYEIDTSEVNTSRAGGYTINITPYNSEFTACSFDITIWYDDKTFYWRACKFGATSSNSSYSLTNTDETGLAEEAQLTSWNGAGKVTNSGHDGIVYYYTRINSDNNFTISGDVYVNMFLQGETNLTRYGQEAFGIMARDVIPLTPDSYYSTDSETYEGCGTSIVVQTENAKLDEYGEPVPSNSGSDFFSNVVLAGGFPTSSYKTGDNATAANANNNRMKLWIRTGMKLWDGTSGAVTNREYLLYDGSEFDDYLITAEEIETGECFYPQKGDQYNIVLSRINGGYYVETTLLAVGEGNEEYSDLIGTTWSYAWDYSLDGGLESDPLLEQNADTIYAGFFAARWADISVTNIAVYESCTDTDYTAAGENTKKEDPSLSLKSSLYTYDTEYTLILAADNSYGGNVIIKLGDEVIANGTSVGTDNTAFSLSLEPNTANELVIAYTPSSYAYLTSYSTITYRYTLYCLGAASSGATIYAAPEEGSGESESGVYGTFYNSGTKTSPLNLDTAVAIVEEGQTIVLLNGTYYRDSAIEITDANCGASGGYKTLKAETDGGVTIDMQRNDAGIIIGGDYWHIKGIKFLNSAVGESGGYLSGSHCIIDSCVFAESGSTGFQIAGSSSDSFSLWPSNNLIVYCESYNSVSNTAGAADGFGCKLAVGNGNIFKNCVAHNNDDDGWDLYTKTSTGAIGAVLLEDCISYNCSYYLITEDNLGGANAGTARNKAVFGSSLDPANYAVGEQVLVQSASASGNGFKLGGENTYVQHYIKDSFAFGNKAKGFDSNSNPAMKIRNCIAYNNGTARQAINSWGYAWTVSKTPSLAPNYGLYSGVTDLTFNYNLDGVISACAYTSDNIATYSSYLSGTNQADSSSTLTSLYNTAQSTNTERYPVLTLNKNLKAAHIESRTNYLVKSTDDLSTAEWGTTRDGHTLTGYVSVNSEGDEITPDWFVSLNESDAIGDDGFIINHSAGGAYDLGDFLKPNSDYIYLYSTSDIPDYSDTYILFFGTEYQQGDVDKNGDVDLIDSISILKYINDEMLFSKSQLELADVNGDGEIDKKDAALALKKAILNA